MKSSYLLTILSIVAVLMLAFAAGCTGNGTKTTVASTAPTASPTVVATTQMPASTPVAQVTTQAPVSTGQKQTIKAETVIIAAGIEPNPDFFRAVEGKFQQVYIAGDSGQSGLIRGAISSGADAALKIQ